ncbi:MAG: hypothetical protein U0736_15930 [Gemmataceae bacterium]
MPRADLLALSADDLAALSTRGKVNEARKDLDDNGVTGTLTESPAGDVSVAWSDGRTSELPAGATLQGGRCSCQAVGTCKHLVRLVLLYQPPVGRADRRAAAACRRGIPAPSATTSWAATIDRRRSKSCTGSRRRHFRRAGPRHAAGAVSRPGVYRASSSPATLRYTRCDCAPGRRRARPCAAGGVGVSPAAGRQSRAGVVTAGAAAAGPADLLGELDTR